MGRGDKGTYNQQEQQAFGNANQAAQKGTSAALQGYGGELANPGYTPAEEQAMRQAASGSLAGAFGAARTRLRNQASRTGNTAGENATEEQLGMQQGQQTAQAEGALEADIANQRIQGLQNASAGLAGVGNAGMANASNLTGTQSRVAMQPGFWGRVLAGGLNKLG